MDTVALVSVISSATVAVSVAFVSVFAAMREGKATREHERLLARDELLFGHRASAYEAEAHECEIFMAFLESIHPKLPPGPTSPKLPSVDDQAANLGRFATYASEEACELLTSFRRLKWDFEGCVRRFGRAKSSASRARLIDEMNRVRGAAKDCLEQLEAQIRKELDAA